MHSSTSNSKTYRFFPAPTAAGWLACAVFALGTTFFHVYPDAFVVSPESVYEARVYTIDQRIKATHARPRAIIQGTSRLMDVKRIPLEPGRPEADPSFINLSVPGNTFWHMLVIHRRNPELTANAEFAVVDLVPMQLGINNNFTEDDPLFFRESTLEEKWRIANPWVRARALLDTTVPIWSGRHTAVSWARAIRLLHAPIEARLAATEAFPEKEARLFRMAARFEEEGGDTPAARRETVATMLYRLERPSTVQREALTDLVARFPASCELLFIRPPLRSDFSTVVSAPDRQERDALLRETATEHASAHVVVAWMEDPSELRWTDNDYSEDGFHITRSGTIKIQNFFGRRYRDWLAQRNTTAEN